MADQNVNTQKTPDTSQSGKPTPHPIDQNLDPNKPKPDIDKDTNLQDQDINQVRRTG
jgi:hypothetical protein